LNNLETEIQTIQPIIEQIFPNIAEVPVNSISSSIYGEGEEKRIYFLIVGDNHLIRPFLEDTKDEAKVKTVLSAEKSQNKLEYDLIMEFGFYFRRGKASFKVVFHAALPELQKQYLAALKQVEGLRFIIADQDRLVRKVFELDWYYYKNRKVIDKVEKMNP